MPEPTACPVDRCDETIDYTALYDHLYGDHDADELCATIANLVADAAGMVAELAALRGAVSAARVVAKHGDMPEQTRHELNDALNTEG
jgi:hypothetical protein